MSGQGNILAVDDTFESLALLVATLSEAGYKVFPADSGELALAAVAVNPPDLILLDIRMPGMNGIEVCRRLKARKETRHIPIILVSAFADASEWVEGLKAGGADYVSKPYRREELLTRVKAHLALSQMGRSLEQQAGILGQTNEQLQTEIAQRQRSEDALRQSLSQAERSPLAMVSVLEDQKQLVAALQTKEQELLEAKALTDAVVENIPLMIFLKEASELRFVLFNRAGEELLGYDRKTLLGKNNLDLFPAEQAAHFMAKDREVLEGAACVLDIPEEPILTGKKGERLLHTRKVCIRGRDGATKYLLGISEDITERKQGEEALRHSEERFRLLFTCSRDAIMTLSPPSWQFTSGNAAAVAMFRARDEADFTSRAPWEYSPERQPDGKQSVEKAREMIEVGMREGSHVFEWTHRRLNGEDFLATVLLSRTQIAGESFLQATVRDITEQKHAAEVHARLTMAVEQALEMVIITDPEATIQYVNPAFTAVTGYSREEVIGQNPRILKSGKQGAEFYQRMWAALTAGNAFACHMINRRKDGSFYEEEANISPVRDATGRIVNYVGVKRDVTHEVQLEVQLRQSQKLETIGTLASGVAHEINNPIMGIMGYAEVMRDRWGATHAELMQYTVEILKETERVAKIVKNLLSFARHDTDTCSSPARPCDIIDSTLSLVRTVMRHDQVAVAVDVPGDLPLVVCCNQQIQQVLMNLLTNARDALNQRYPGHSANKKIAVSAKWIPDFRLPGTESEEVRDPVAGGIRITVEDLGAGIPEDLRSRIFDPFFTTKSRDKGTGLGLSISHSIVKDHGGVLWMESEVGQWTRFHVDLPCRGSGEGIAKRAAGPDKGSESRS